MPWQPMSSHGMAVGCNGIPWNAVALTWLGMGTAVALPYPVTMKRSNGFPAAQGNSSMRSVHNAVLYSAVRWISYFQFK